MLKQRSSIIVILDTPCQDKKEQEGFDPEKRKEKEEKRSRLLTTKQQPKESEEMTPPAQKKKRRFLLGVFVVYDYNGKQRATRFMGSRTQFLKGRSIIASIQSCCCLEKLKRNSAFFSFLLFSSLPLLLKFVCQVPHSFLSFKRLEESCGYFLNKRLLPFLFIWFFFFLSSPQVEFSL